MKKGIRKMLGECRIVFIEGENLILSDVTNQNQIQGRHMRMFSISDKYQKKELGKIALLDDNEIWCQTYPTSLQYEEEAIKLIINNFISYRESFTYSVRKLDFERSEMLKRIGFRHIKIMETTIVCKLP